MVEFVLNALGKCLGLLPNSLLQALARTAGDAIFFAGGERTRVGLANLRHAFPAESEAWRQRVLRMSCRRLVEMALLVPALGTMSAAQVRKRFSLSPAFEARLAQWKPGSTSARPAVFFTPHFTLAEALTAAPALTEVEEGRLLAVYRPLKQARVDAWLLRVRQRFGARLLSKRDGFLQAGRALGRNGGICILFDQNASSHGTLITFMDRIASATELPGLLARRFTADTYILYPRRTGFWRATFEMVPLRGESPAELVIEAHRWLEHFLRASPEQCAEWLWLHKRWRVLTQPLTRFSLTFGRPERNQLALSLRLHGQTALPRRTPVLVWLPNDADATTDAAPLLRALRRARPDFALTVVVPAKAATTPLEPEAADEILLLATDRRKKKHQIDRLRLLYPETTLVLAEDAATDGDVRRIDCPQIFGLARNTPRPVLTTAWTVPTELNHLPRRDIWMHLGYSYGLPRPSEEIAAGE